MRLAENVYDLEAKAAKPRVLKPSTQEITGLGFVGAELMVAARDGLVGVSDDQNVIRIYAVPGLARRAQYAWHRASVTALAWGLGPTLIAADNDGELAAWALPPPP